MLTMGLERVHDFIPDAAKIARHVWRVSLMNAEGFDGIIIGSGQHGLVLGTYLAKCGLRILLLERRLQYGGGLGTQRVTLPSWSVAAPRYPGRRPIAPAAERNRTERPRTERQSQEAVTGPNRRLPLST